MSTTAVSILERATCCETERQDRLRLSSLSISTSKPPFPIFPSPSQTSPCCCPPQQRSLRWDNLSRVIRFNSIDHTYSPFPRIPAKEAGGKKRNLRIPKSPHTTGHNVEPSFLVESSPLPPLGLAREACYLLRHGPWLLRPGFAGRPPSDPSVLR